WLGFDGSAKRNSDFITQELSGGVKLTIPAGRTSFNFEIEINNDKDVEGNETIKARIESIQNAIVGRVSSYELTIIDDDSKPTKAETKSSNGGKNTQPGTLQISTETIVTDIRTNGGALNSSGSSGKVSNGQLQIPTGENGPMAN